MQALILAGGLGMRLRSALGDKPKPMAPINAKPFIEYQLEFLKGYGIRDFIFCVCYLRKQIQDYFHDGGKWGVQIQYSVEDEPLGTAGAIKQSKHLIDYPILVLNGDSFLKLNIAELINFHEQKRYDIGHSKYLGTIALATTHASCDYGIVQLDAKNNIVGFVEKFAGKTGKPILPQLINSGIYLLEANFFEHIPANEKISLEKQTIPKVLNRGYIIGGYATSGYFIDIGTPERYEQARRDLQENLYDYSR
ncbi:MAG: nucleotidyltransferase family protein [Caldilineaceae bacterium]